VADQLPDIFEQKPPSLPPSPPPRSSAENKTVTPSLPDIFESAPKQEAAPQPNAPKGNIATTSLLKYFGKGTTVTEAYDKLAKTILPRSIQRSKGADWMSRFAVELGKAPPEVVDFVTSPVGLALTAAHLFPATAPVAGIVDLGIGFGGLMQAAPKSTKAFKSGSPEDWADAIADIVTSLGAAKAGAKTLVARTAGYRLVPLEERSALRKQIAQAPDEAKIPMLEKAKAEAPSKGLQKLYEHQGARDIADVFDVPKPKLLQISADIVADRAAFKAIRNFDINSFLYDFKAEVPVADRDIRKLGYVIQGDATADEVGLSKEARQWLPELRKWTKEQDDLLRAAWGDSVSLQESEAYLTQMWDFKGRDPAFRAGVSRTLMHDPYLKERKIPGYKTGIEEYGLKPKYTDVADVLKLRADTATQVIANVRMANWLRSMGTIVTETEAKDLGLNGWKRATDAEALYRVTYAGTTTKEHMPYFERRPVYVHPDFDMAVNSVFGHGLPTIGESGKTTLFGALDTMRALGKRAIFTFSMFHYNTLSEQGRAIYALRKPLPGIGKTPKGVRAGDALRQTFLFNPHFFSGVKSGVYEAIGRSGDRPPVMRMDPSIVREALGRGLNLNSEEREGWLIDRLRDMTASNNIFAKVSGGPVRTMASLMSSWDSALWDYYHQGTMLDAYETIMADELPKLGKDATPERIDDLGRTVANHVNNAYGAVSWEKMLISPRARQALNFLMLAPGWSVSRLRVLTSGFENEAASRITSKYVTGAALSWFLTTQALNYALSGYFKTEDRSGKKGAHFSWDNPGPPARVGDQYLDSLTTNAFNVSVGYNPDGSQRYLELGKGFREPMGWLMSPIETLGNKLSLPLRWSIVQLGYHEPGSGFEEINPRASGGEQATQRLYASAEALGIPLVARGVIQKGAHKLFPETIAAPTASSQLFGFPTRRGMSLTTAIKEYGNAADLNNWDMASEVLAAAAINKVDPRSVIRGYRSDKRKKQRQVAGSQVEYDAFGNVVKK